MCLGVTVNKSSWHIVGHILAESRYHILLAIIAEPFRKARRLGFLQYDLKNTPNTPHMPVNGL